MIKVNKDIRIDTVYTLSFKGCYNRIPMIELTVKEFDIVVEVIRISLNDFSCILNRLVNTSVFDSYTTSMNDQFDITDEPDSILLTINNSIHLHLNDFIIEDIVDTFTELVSKI